MTRVFSRWTVVVASAALCGGLWLQTADAGQSTSSSSQAAQQAPQLAEIVVTAERRAEPLQKVPMSVSAISGATLRAMGAEDFTEYARTIPGLTFANSGAGRQTPSIRGLVATAGEATVGYYIDDTPIPGTGTINKPGVVENPTLIDVKRIEVLRGPQGTLYGSGSIGGTIRIITNPPNLSTVEGWVRGKAVVTQGADGASPGDEEDMVLNLPIVKGLAAVRGVFWYRNIGGYINRTWTNSGQLGIATGPVVGTAGNLPDEHTWGMRTTVLYEPFPHLAVSALIFLQRQHFNGFTDITGGPGNPNNQLVQNFISNTPEPQANDFSLYSLTEKYTTGRVKLVSVTSYFTRNEQTSEEGTSLFQLAPTFFGQPAFNGAIPNVGTFRQNTSSFSQEARLSTTRRIYGFDAVAGIFYQDTHNPSFYYNDYPPGYNQLVAGNNPANPAYAPNENTYTATGPGFKQHQLAEYGQLTYHLTDALALTGGIRHYDVANRFQYRESGLFIGGNVPGVVSLTDVSSQAGGNVYKANLSYNITPNRLVYAQFAEGFRPGFGIEPPGAICGAAAFQHQVVPDSIKSYELGAKTEWLNKRLMVDASGYRIDWNNIQQERLLACGFGVGANFGNAVIKGAELQASAQVTRSLSMGVSGTYLDTTLLQGNPLSGALPGDPIEYVPKWQYALYVQTTFPGVLGAEDGTFRLDYQYTGHSIANYSRLANGAFNPSDEVHVVRMLNARVSERYHSWGFALSVMNLLNDISIQSVDPNASITVAIPGRPRYVITRPRTFSVSATYHF